jgi:tetratricopeptide (TPR) repeat protein
MENTMYKRDIRLVTRLITSCVLLFGCLVVSVNGYASKDEVLKKAEEFIKNGDSIRAYDLLLPYEDDLSGDTGYDYLLGVSALDSGEPRRAIFAFQRAVNTDPNFAGARMELARSYFEIGELEQAESEFRTLLTLSPSEPTREVIEKYLATIENKSLASSRGFHGYVLIGFGDDSNANNATAANDFLGFELSPESREQSSTVMLAKAGFIYNLPVDYYRTYFVAANIGHRSNNDASYTNSLSMDATAGVRQTFNSGNFLGFNLQAYNTLVDGGFNNRGVFASGQYGKKFSADDQLTGYLRVGSIRFADLFKVKDVDQGVVGLSWIHVFSALKRPSINLSLLYGQDKAVQDLSPYDRGFYGANLSAVVALSHRWNLYGMLGVVESDFDDPFFGMSEARADSQSIASMGATWYPSKVWSVQPVVRYVKNESNVVLYDYDKIEFLITARSDF